MFQTLLTTPFIIFNYFPETEQEQLPSSPFWTLFLSGVSVLAAFFIVFLVLYMKRRKPASFNEVPTLEPEAAASNNLKESTKVSSTD